MLQYSAQPIPLPISYRSQLARKDILPDLRPNDSQNPPSRLFNKRFTKDRSSRPSQQRYQQHPPPFSLVNHHSPHSVSAPLPAFSPAPSPLPSPLPLPSFISPPPSSPLALPSPLPASAPLPLPSSSRPCASRSAASTRPTSARHSTSGSSIIEDVLAPGDFIGEGILLQGHHICLSPAPVSHDTADFGLAREFEVVRKLGTGSYAVVYLVREVLSRAQPSDDGHCGILDLGEPTRSKTYVTYGRDFALKCLSKANLDQDALAAQMTEVSPRGNSLYASKFTLSHRSLSISLFVPIPTS